MAKYINACVYAGGGYVQTDETGDFVAIGSWVGNFIWYGIGVKSTGVTYYLRNASDLYKADDQLTSPSALGAGINGTDVTVDKYDTVYICKNGGLIYTLDENEEGYTAVTVGNEPWIAIEGSPNGEVWATQAQAGSSDIYLKPDGESDFAFFQNTITGTWWGLTSADNYDMWLARQEGGLYKKADEDETFTLFDSMSGINPRRMCVTPSDSLYICHWTGKIYEKPTGTANFNDLGQASLNWFALGKPFNVTIPDAPSNVSAVAGDEQVTISWDAVYGATSYNIYWLKSSPVTQETGTEITGETSPYIHLSLDNDDTYYYVVTAINDSGESVDSSEVNATPTEPPPAPYNPNISRAGHTEKVYFAKVFENNVSTDPIAFLKKEVLDLPDFSAQINSIPDTYTFMLGMPINDFGEGTTIKIKNKVQIFIRDRESESHVIFQGFISKYLKVKESGKEFIKVTLLNDSAQMAKYVLEGPDGTTEFNYTLQDISVIIKDLINKFRVGNPATTIRYTETSIDTSGTTTTAKFSCATVTQALNTIMKIAPEGWYWKVDADGLFHFHSYNKASPDHTLHVDKNIEKLEMGKSMMDLANTVYFIGGKKVDAWTLLYNASTEVIKSFTSISGTLYFGTNAGKIYKYDGTDIYEMGFVGAVSAEITQLQNANDKLYFLMPNIPAWEGKLFEAVHNGATLDISEVAPQLNGQDIHVLTTLSGSVYGGTTTSGRLHKWNGTNAWTEVAPQLDSGINIVGLSVLNAKVYGVLATGKLYEFNTVDAWVERASPPAYGSASSSVTHNGTIFINANNSCWKWDGASGWIIANLYGVVAMHVHKSVLYGYNNAHGGFLKFNGIEFELVWADAGSVFITNLYSLGNALYAGGVTASLASFAVWSGSGNFYFKKIDSDSQNEYGTFSVIKSDQRITTAGSANSYCDSELSKNKNPKITGKLIILDSNGDNFNRGYDLEIIDVGESIQIKGFDENIYIIIKTKYMFNRMLVELADISFIKTTKLRELVNDVNSINTEGVPSSPTLLT